ncbi:MAG TPA: fumarylacetoacetase [Euzebyales bacterium]|nr:fumarylacetoacetase [Euzebyales bacterium]
MAAAQTWVSRPRAGFGIEHLPYGVFAPVGGDRRLGARIGDRVLDLRAAARARIVPEHCDAPDLGRLLAADVAQRRDVRAALIEALTDERRAPALAPLLHDVEDVRLLLPFRVGDYVDFYSAEAHARNVGAIFRPGQPALPPNYRYLPIGYHGRAGSVVVSRTRIVRPQGQMRSGDGEPVFGPTRKLDIELELGVVVAGTTRLGQPVPIARADAHIFGVALVNDWSARDIQQWESRPLGPFLSKSFATSLAAWVTPLEALEPYRVPGPPQDPPPLPYLRTGRPWAFDLQLEVRVSSLAMRSAGHASARVSRVHHRELYWNMAQQLAHMTANGAPLAPGDLYASGTISGAEPGSYGSLLELTWDGTEPIALPDGTSRTYLEDGDEVVLTGATPDGAIRLGSVIGSVAPSGDG